MFSSASVCFSFLIEREGRGTHNPACSAGHCFSSLFVSFFSRYLHKDAASRFMPPSVQQRTSRRSCHRGPRSATCSQKETKRGTSNRDRSPAPGGCLVQAGLNVPCLIVHSDPKSIS